jgi:hypothetical protein
LQCPNIDIYLGKAAHLMDFAILKESALVTFTKPAPMGGAPSRSGTVRELILVGATE